MSRNDADRNLLFGIVAVQMNFVTRDALIEAMGGWALAKHRPLAEILVERGAMTASRRKLLDDLVDEHIRQHGDDPARSLAAVGSASGIVSDIRRSIVDPEIRASLVHASPPSDDPGATRMPGPDDPLTPRTRYRKLRDHARGGLGIVYVAVDEELNREVALKEIQDHHADNAHSRSRFVVEAEVTGGLEHPGIVPVYGLGRDATGRPFYAMRFIKGDSLTDAIQRFQAAESHRRDPGERSLSLRKLLRRFLDVCNAIDYAHSRGVLHRDLKPDNIMVGKYGETLVVDWGLAKATGLSGESLDDTLPDAPLRPMSGDGPLSVHGKALGTPSYMPPEQAAGRLDLLGPASDVYSLGATLYALITGKPPVTGTDLLDILRKVQSGEIPRPRVSSPWVDPALEAICLKAMSLAPTARYPTARALADDLERYLADEPVTAHREPWTRRARRWTRKHRTAVTTTAATALVATLLGGGLALSLTLQTRATDTAALAILAKSNTLAIEARIKSDPSLWAAAIAEARTAEARLDAGRGSRELRRQVAATLASLQSSERNLRDALLADARDKRMLDDLDEARLRRANVKHGYFDSDSMTEAFVQAFRSYGIDVSTLSEAEAIRRVRSSRIAEHLVAVLDEWEWFETNKATSSRLWTIAASVDADPQSTALRSMIARKDTASLNALLRDPALLKKNGPRTRLIVNALRRLDPPNALVLLERLRSEHPSDFWYNYDLAMAYSHSSPHRHDQAIRFYSAALALRPTNSGLHANIGNALSAQGDKPGAIASYREAIRLKPDYTEAHFNLGIVLSDQGDKPGAIASYREAIRLKPDDAEAHCNLGQALRSQGQYQEALAALRRGHELGSRQPGWAYPSAGWVKDCERAVELDAKLADVLGGKSKPKDTEEELAVAAMCYEKAWHATSARFYEAAFASSRDVVDNLELGHRYNAACAAALAGAGQGKDDPKPDEAALKMLREKARNWLRADLVAWGKRLDEGKPDAAPTIVKMLTHWKSDTDLAGIRDEASLAKLPAPEREVFRALWSDVESLHAKAAAKR